MTNLELHFESPACNIYYDTELKVVHPVWKGVFVSNEEFYKILNDIINLLSLKKTNALLADTRLIQEITVQDQEWIINDWYPRAVKAGFNCEALIVSKSSFNEFVIKQIVRMFDDKIQAPLPPGPASTLMCSASGAPSIDSRHESSSVVSPAEE